MTSSTEENTRYQIVNSRLDSSLSPAATIFQFKTGFLSLKKLMSGECLDEDSPLPNSENSSSDILQLDGNITICSSLSDSQQLDGQESGANSSLNFTFLSSSSEISYSSYNSIPEEIRQIPVITNVFNITTIKVH